MGLVERVQDIRLARRAFLDANMPAKGEEVCVTGILARPLYELVATYEAAFFPKTKYSLHPGKEVGNVTYLH